LKGTFLFGVQTGAEFGIQAAILHQGV